MPPKRRAPEAEIKEVPGGSLNRMDLAKYCPKKIFDILFVSEADEYSNKISNKIIEISKGYEDISCLTFITYDEVMDLLTNYENSLLPIEPKMQLIETCTNIKEIVRAGQEIPPDLFAQLMKLKLIEVMYKHYIKEVKNMQKRTKLEEDLNNLTRECTKSAAKGSRQSKAKDGSKKGSETSDKRKGKNKGIVEEEVIEDYTTIPIVGENEIIFEDDIAKHVWFYVFQGFSDASLLIKLISENNVPITSVIKLTADDCNTDEAILSKSANEKYTKYWDQLDRYWDGPQRVTCLENTNLMSYTYSGENYMEIFQHLLHVVKIILDIKLQHLHYIRHVEIYKPKKSYNYFPLECLNIYNRMLEKIPIELTNEPVVLSCLLNEVCARIDNVWNIGSVWDSCSDHSAVSAQSSRDQCVSPCSIGVFFTNEMRTEPKKTVLKKLKKSFLAYENDELTIILNSYKKIGPLLYDLTLNMLRNTKPLINLDDYINDRKEIIHKHDIDPSTKTNNVINESLWHILYLLMFVGFEHEEDTSEFEGTDLTQYLQIYDKLKFVESLQTKILEENVEEMEETDTESSKDSEERTENLYNTSAIKYFWKEILSSTVMPQVIFKIQNDYLYVDHKYSPETDNLLLQFCDNLDEFGVKTKVYEQSLITPVCLRDFCRYVTIDAADWLEVNKPPKYTRKSENLEECRGVAKLDQMRKFQEYRYLLNPSVNTDVEVVTEKTNEESKGVTFEYLVEELKNYPTSLKIIEECNASKKEKQFLAYDFGTKYFKIHGGQTIFHSHDNVKLSVDNTRFIDDVPKCTVNLSCKNNSLVLHSDKFYYNKDYIFHMNLSDGTIVSFVVMNSKTMRGKRRSDKSEESYEWNDTSEIVGEGDTKEEEQRQPVNFKTEPNVISVDEKYFKSNIERNLTESNPNSFQQADNMFSYLKRATLDSVPIYKVTNRVNTNAPLLEKLRPAVKIPVANIIKRVLHKTIRKDKMGSFTKRYIPKKKWGSTARHPVESRICFPNGLYVTFYPSEVKKHHVEVKQEFLTRNLEDRFTEQEEFRLFTREGYVLVKKVNGAITILKSNGDTLHFENIDTDSKNVNKWNLRPCHCKNINDYRKKLNKMLKSENEDVTSTAVSRRAQFRTKKGYILDEEIVNMLERSKVPYLKNTLIKFNGTRICLKSMKVTQRKLYFMTQEQDFYKQEVFFERSDGFTSIFDLNGKQQVKFADGTKISSTIHIAKELADGYVYISLNFQYEHPSYATVFYDFDYSLQILLNNAVFKRDEQDKITLKIDEDIVTTVQKENIVFEKICPKCSSIYNCTFNIKPFRINQIDFSKEFVHVHDTYNKHFYVDFAGNCTRKSDYIKGAFNVNNCNHWKNMVYKKLFVVNRDLSGEMFRTDNLVTTKQKLFEADEYCSVKNCVKDNIEVLRFERKVFNDYRNRFFNISLLKEQHCLEKYKQPQVDGLFYAIFFIMNKMTDIQGIQSFVSNLMANFPKDIDTESRLLNTLNKTLDEYEVCMREDTKSTKSQYIEVPDISCRCRKVRVGILDKLRKWQELCTKYRKLIHEKDIPLYFKSPFCQVTEH